MSKSDKMSFFGKFKTSSVGGIQHGGWIWNDASKQANSTPTKKDPNAPQLTPLEKHLVDVTGPTKPDGSDKYFGFENYGSTCYANSIIQCLYYSAPFREHVINFPSPAFVEQIRASEPNGAPLSPRSTSTTPYPNPNSPARKQNVPTSPGPGGAQKPEESKDSPEFRKRMALAAGPVLDMTSDNSNKYGMDESLFTSLRDIFDSIAGHQSRIGVVSPHRFLEILRRENEMFRSAMHQDAHEFLNLLLNQVVDNVEMFAKQHPEFVEAAIANGHAPEEGALVKAQSKPTLDTHWVHDLFEGLLTSETRCLTCENTSQRDEAFLDLSVDLDSHTSVTSCLRKFSEEEMLCERNKFHCDNCGGLQEAEKRMKIKRLPRILALHLKRFKYTEDLQRLQKLFHRVVYPFYLRLFNTTDDAEDPDRLYELYSVVVHIGGGPYHGHYVSIVKTQDKGWLLFDDELVEPVSKDYVQQFFGGEPVPGVQDAKQLATAYVLFYQETTMEAMLKEQEAEAGQKVQAATRVSEGDDNRTSLSSPVKANGNGLQHAITNLQTPIAEEETFINPLVHANTAPNFGSIDQSAQFEPPVPPKPILPTKSKKELKAEEKAAEKARKAAEKAEQKAREERYHEASRKRMEVYRNAEEEMRKVMEESKRTAEAEAEARGDSKKSEKGGLSRFRHGSMSLSMKGKPKIFGGSGSSKQKDRESVEEARQPILTSPPPAPAPAENGIKEEDENEKEECHDADVAVDSSEPSVGDPKEREKEPRTTVLSRVGTGYNTPPDAPTALPPIPHPPEEKVRKHRFSLGRKKSTLI
ncbi:putative ubiquitin carboxyl-terminal hydrolase creB [Pseudocercospora fuligena]|uniref:Ubiquitin carboxyl-terminal hydrolase n=1 Tax=Pseudocercospora fuligena TaxID=685502 RepID=A0A8H6VEG7_9PEZI|nr:putative ubiquitin carboxyl-terminal hydrolase creB [Pseudocercospora fuligena]